MLHWVGFASQSWQKPGFYECYLVMLVILGKLPGFTGYTEQYFGVIKQGISEMIQK